MQSDRQAWWDCNGGGGPAGAGTWGWLRAAVVPEQLSKPFRSWLPWIWKTQLHRQEEFGPLEGEASTNLHSHQRCTRIPFSPQPHQYLLFLVSFLIAILTGMKFYIVMVLICILLM